VAQVSTEARWQMADLQVKQTKGDQSAGPKETNNVHFIHHVTNHLKIKGMSTLLFER
jgi:hypothetical protein